MSETYSVYFNTGSGMTLIESGISAVELTIGFGPFLYNTGYSWRVDATNGYGTTTGDTWTFTSLVFAPPLPTGVSLSDVAGSEGVITDAAKAAATGSNNIITLRKLLAAANNRIWFEDV